PLLVVVPHESDLRIWLEALRLVRGGEAGVPFPSPSLSPYQEADASLQVRVAELLALDRGRSGEIAAVVVTPRALFRRLPDPASIERLELARGAQIDTDELARRLTGLGFRRVDLVAEVGDFAVRGGVFD